MLCTLQRQWVSLEVSRQTRENKFAIQSFSPTYIRKQETDKMDNNINWEKMERGKKIRNAASGVWRLISSSQSNVKKKTPKRNKETSLLCFLTCWQRWKCRRPLKGFVGNRMENGTRWSAKKLDADKNTVNGNKREKNGTRAKGGRKEEGGFWSLFGVWCFFSALLSPNVGSIC